MPNVNSCRSQLLGEALDAVNHYSHGEASREETLNSKRKGKYDESGNSVKRRRRDVVDAIKRCLVAGLYMNAARFSLQFLFHRVDDMQTLCK